MDALINAVRTIAGAARDAMLVGVLVLLIFAPHVLGERVAAAVTAYQANVYYGFTQ